MRLSFCGHASEQVPINRFKLVISQFRIQTSAQLKRTVIGIRQSHAEPQEFVANKPHIESRVMRNERAVFDKLPQERHDLGRLRFTNQHLIRDAVHLLRGPVNLLFYADERMKLFTNHGLIKRNHADFNDSVFPGRRKPGRLHVNGDEARYGLATTIYSVIFYGS